jgi:membrane protease YdiL (CAAX protease family)
MPLTPADYYQICLIVAGVFVLARQTRRARGEPSPPIEPWKARWLDFLLWLWVILISIYLGEGLLGLIYAPARHQPPDDLSVVLSGVVFQGCWLAAQLGMVLTRRSWSPAPVNREPMGLGRAFVQGGLAFLAAYPIIIAVSLVWQWLLQLFGFALSQQDAVKILEGNPTTMETTLLVVFAVAAAPIAEELFFRAGFYRFLKSQMRPLFALLVASALFAFAHANLLTFAPLFVLGVLLARAYEKSGNLAVPIVFHALFNLNTIALTLLFPDQVSKLIHSP